MLNKLQYFLMGLFVVALGLYVFITLNNTTEFFRPEEVAVVDDKTYQTDEEGRIFVPNSFKRRLSI